MGETADIATDASGHWRTQIAREVVGLRAENERLLAALTELHRTSQLCWDDDSDETPGHVKDPWFWAEWINAIEVAAPLVKTHAHP